MSLIISSLNSVDIIILLIVVSFAIDYGKETIKDRNE